MKAALIPPVAHLREFADGDPLHLVLSHLLTNTEYRQFYREQHLKGAYLILDNGAHENKAGEVMRDLLLKAMMIRASEVVLPDTLFDHHATVRGAQDALNYLMADGQDVWAGAPYPTFMVVPQGNTRNEYERCFQDLIEVYVKAQVARPDLFIRNLTIGVSKDYDSWKGKHYSILEFLTTYRQWMKFDIHLLGWARDLTALDDLAQDFDIRSTDSAKPFVYAMHEIGLARGVSPQYPTRPPDYFYRTLTPAQVELAKHNVLVFRRTANDFAR